MKVSNTWKPVLSQQVMTNACVRTKLIQIYVDHLKKYSPSNKAVHVFKYNAAAAAASMRTANEDSSPVPSVLNFQPSSCSNLPMPKSKVLPSAISKLIHVDLKQLTQESGFDETSLASTEMTSQANLPHLDPDQCSKIYASPPLQVPTLNQQNTNVFHSMPRQTAPIIVNNVVYTPEAEKRNRSLVTTHVKMLSPKIVLQKLSTKRPKCDSNILSTKTVQLPSNLNTLRINQNRKYLQSDLITETKERKDELKIKTRKPEIQKPKMNSALHKEPPVLTLQKNFLTSLENNESNKERYKKRDLILFNGQMSKFQALHELLKVLREQEKSYPENTFLQYLHKKLKKDKSPLNMAKLQKLKEGLHASSANPSVQKENIKEHKHSFCRLKTFCSKVQPYSIVKRASKSDLGTLAANLSLSNNLKASVSETRDKKDLETEQNTRTSINLTNGKINNFRHYALRGHIKLSSSHGRLFNHIHLKPGSTGKRKFIIDDLKINLIDLERKIKRYTDRRITPLCEERQNERKNTIKRENTKDYNESLQARKSISDDSKILTFSRIPKDNKLKPRKEQIRKDSLTDSLDFRKQAPFSTKLTHKKNLEILRNSILIKSCFPQPKLKTDQSTNKDLSEQQKSLSEIKTVSQNIRKFNSKLESNKKPTLKTNSWRVNSLQAKVSNDIISKQYPFSPRTLPQKRSSTEMNKNQQQENWTDKSSRQVYNKDTLKAFTFQSQSFYSDYQHRKFRQF